VRKCAAALCLAETIVCIPLVLWQRAMLHAENTTKTLGARGVSVEPLLFICSHISVTLQTCKLACAIIAYHAPLECWFLHAFIRHSGLPCSVFFITNVALLFPCGLDMIGYLSLIMSFSSMSLWLQQKGIQYGLCTKTQGSTDWVAVDTKNGQFRKLVYSSDLECFGTTCNICLEEFEQGVKIKQLRCNHVFHVSCVDHWYRAHRSCPLRCELNGKDSWKPSTSDRLFPVRSHAQVAHEHEQDDQNQRQNVVGNDSHDESESNTGCVLV